jgi:hypothetical protein
MDKFLKDLKKKKKNRVLGLGFMDASTSMIILLRETIRCGNADCNLDKQVSLSSPSLQP